MKTEFLKPRFTGPRFDQHTLPVEVAADLAAYEELVVELAKHLWLQEHPGRQRVPWGFEKSFNLHLEGVVEEGSARPTLAWVTAGVLTINITCGTYFEQARDLITECIKTNAANQPMPPKFPKELLDYFNVFGRSLIEGESLELPGAAATAPAVLTPERRKQLVLAARKVYTKAVELVGTIGETDWEKQTFRLRLKDGPAVIVPLPEAFNELARTAGGRERTSATVKGVGVFDAWDRLQKVQETHHLELQPNAILAEALSELAILEDGWYEGKGKAPDKDKLAWLSDQLVETFPPDLPFPHVGPTPDGGLFLEWIQKPWRISAEIMLSNYQCELQMTNTDTGDSIDKDCDLAQATEWPGFYEFVRKQV